MGYPLASLSQRGFVKGAGVGSLALGGGLAGSVGEAAAAPMINVSTVTTALTSVQDLPNAYYLANVRLETGFVEEKKLWLDAPVITRTSTELKTLRIADGKIAEIRDTKAATPPDATAYDAQGQVILPTFRDTHIRLDKTFYGGRGRPRFPRSMAAPTVSPRKASFCRWPKIVQRR